MVSSVVERRNPGGDGGCCQAQRSDGALESNNVLKFTMLTSAIVEGCPDKLGPENLGRSRMPRRIPLRSVDSAEAPTGPCVAPRPTPVGRGGVTGQGPAEVRRPANKRLRLKAFVCSRYKLSGHIPYRSGGAGPLTFSARVQGYQCLGVRGRCIR